MDDLSAQLKKICEDPDCLKLMSDKQIEDLFKRANPYGQQINPDATDYTCISILPMRDQHIMNIDLISIVQYMYRALFEYEDLMNIPENVRASHKRTIDANKRVIERFLDQIFEYNPEKDVRSSYKGFMCEGHPAPITQMTGLCADPNCKCNVLSTFKVPARDLFHRLTRFREANWDKIVQTAGKLYEDKVDFEHAVQVHKHFRSRKAAEEYQRENGAKCLLPIIVVKDGPWTILASCKENQRNTSYFGKGTSELESILRRAENDEKLGRDMIKKRVLRKKKQNILLNKGDLTKGIDEYAKQVGAAKSSMLSEEENKELEEFARKIRAGEIDQSLLYENVDEEGIPLDAVQVDVFETNTQGMDKYTFYTKADFPDNEVTDADEVTDS